jgi:hypothetical protein
MRAQITLTVSEAKRIIAKGIAQLHSVHKALISGRIFLKGGTTVSAVCEELTGKRLRISGRITRSGTKTAQISSEGFHCALIENAKLIDADESLEEIVAGLNAEDVGILGANAIDVYGNAAIFFGGPLGGPPGRIISGLIAEISEVIVAVGLEKLVPGSLPEIIRLTGRKNTDIAMGMAVGLVPIGKMIITEKDAIPLLADVKCSVIGKGGILGAEGGTTMIIDGSTGDVQKLMEIISSVKGSEVSGVPESLIECGPPHEKCQIHKACLYKKS